ncbi:hypothetical protein ACG873_00290 (plasmid) [Mesorhizobium sp. AaZ16]|uniref:hypothetical protein n=1 Tax=Mesorhizobium sp. AaZ16 TaxID=3402289 RepID=UPI00374ED5DB
MVELAVRMIEVRAMVGAGGPANIADGQHLALRATSLVRDPMERKRLHKQLAELFLQPVKWPMARAVTPRANGP